jgi:hypothetical protein
MGGSGSGRQAAPKLPKGKYRLWGDVVSRGTSAPPKKQAHNTGDASTSNAADTVEPDVLAHVEETVASESEGASEDAADSAGRENAASTVKQPKQSVQVASL